PPLYFTILKVLNSFFYLNDYWLRVPSIIFAQLTLFSLGSFIYKKTNLFYGILAILFISVLNSFEEISIYARPYSLLTLLVVLNFITLDQWLCKNSEHTTLKIPKTFYVTLFLISITHHLGLIYFCSLFLSIII